MCNATTGHTYPLSTWQGFKCLDCGAIWTGTRDGGLSAPVAPAAAHRADVPVDSPSKTDGAAVVPVSELFRGDQYLTGSGRTVEIVEIFGGAGGAFRITLADGWSFWRESTDTLRILRAA